MGEEAARKAAEEVKRKELAEMSWPSMTGEETADAKTIKAPAPRAWGKGVGRERSLSKPPKEKTVTTENGNGKEAAEADNARSAAEPSKPSKASSILEPAKALLFRHKTDDEERTRIATEKAAAEKAAAEKAAADKAALEQAEAEAK